MCGIAGYLRLVPESHSPDAAIATRMLDVIRHRGPDGEGQWRSPDGACWLGHRRLAIIDLATGDQPMTNEDGTVWTAFNGEIYNHAELRRELESLGHVFHSHADTEVLVHGYEAWGARSLAQRLQGIFAFAVYDMRTRRLMLCRDPMGVKPLYWWSDGKTLLFASEVKALLTHPALASRRVNRRGVAQFIVTRYASRPETMFEGVYRLPEGHYAEIDAYAGSVPEPQLYWDWQPRATTMAFDDALEELDSLLTRTVEMQLMSDVPLGVQLSGGVDSSTVVALMDTLRRKRSDNTPLKTFSVGFDIPEFSELPHARKVAERYGTEHHEIAVGFREFIEDLPRLCWYYDEPMGEPPAVPTYHMCKMAKEHVSVMLCGEGADELFGGYSKYVFDQFSRAIDWMPNGMRHSLLRSVGSLIPAKGRRVRAIAEKLALADPAERFASWYGGFDSLSQQGLLTPELAAEVGDGGLKAAFNGILHACSSTNTLDRFQYCDLHTRQVDDILVKGDRMSMAASVEARVPFLDHRLAEFAARLPQRFRVDGLKSKVLLKKLAERYIPHEVIYRRKVGFTVPLTRWFAGPLAGLLRAVLLSEQALSRGYFRPETVRRVIDEHVAGRVDHEQGLWLLLTLEVWHRLFVDGDGSEATMQQVNADFSRMLHQSCS